jgi:glyoxylase-like metal-dependent hydrolase (beta-lactamase superfamily II)
MYDINRRNLMVGAVLAAAFGLPSRLVIDPALAQATADPAEPYHTYTVGDAKVTAIYDGIQEKPHDPAFIANASIEDTKAALKQAGLPIEFVSIPYTVSVIKLGGKVILCDSGTGGQVAPSAGKFMGTFKAEGFDPAKVDTILISHMHPDHIFGLMEKDTNKQVFPNAEIIVSDAEYRFWTDPSVIEKLPEKRKGLAKRIQATFPKWKNVRQVSGEVEVVAGIHFINAPGHTPGHRAFLLASGKEQHMFSNDTCYVPALGVAHPEWHGSYDQNGDMAEASRRKIMDRAIADSIAISGYHFPFPGSGKIVKDGAGYALVSDKV